MHNAYSVGAQHEHDDAADGGAGARQSRRSGQGPLQPALPVARGQTQHHHLRPAEVRTWYIYYYYCGHMMLRNFSKINMYSVEL